MHAIQALSVRTAAAARRLAELERRRIRAGGDQGRFGGDVIRELHAAIELLDTAVAHLNETSDALAAARAEIRESEARYEELFEALPIACLHTDEEGVVIRGNAAAGALFNISSRSLPGRPLVLFVSDRDAFARLLTVTEAERDAVVAEIIVRPRDRKPRALPVQVQHLASHGCRCWFFLEADRRSVTAGIPGAAADTPQAD